MLSDDTPKPRPSGAAKLLARIDGLTKEHFYGSLTVNFRDGRPTTLDEKRTIKLDGENQRKES